MPRSFVPSPSRRLAMVGLVGLLVIGGAQVAGAHRTDLRVEVVSDQSSITPDGRSMSFHITTQCDRKWTIVEARVTAVQPQASGEASFTPRCNRLTNGVNVTVPALQGTFETGQAEVSALLVVQQGKTKESSDSASVRVRPSVSVVLADQALLEGGGQAARIDVTVTCPVAANGRGGDVRVYDGQVVATGSFPATPCDATPHTVSVRVETSGGSFQPGSAEAFAFAGIEEGGDIFQGADLRTVTLTQP